MTRHDARKLISQARRKSWIVDRRERYARGEGVATYLARYVRGGPVKNQRILKIDRERRTVTLRVSRRGEDFKAIKLRLGELIGRILLHVPPTGYRVVRACGLYHHHYAEKLEACRSHLGADVVINDQPAEVEEDGEEEGSILDEDYCPICGCQLEIETIPRGPPPRELARFWEPRS